MGFTETGTSKGVLPDPTAESQGPPETVLALAVTEGFPLSLVIDSICAAGGVPPIWWTKFKLVGDADNFGSVDTVKVTATSSNESTVVEETRMVPLYWPTARPVGSTVT